MLRVEQAGHATLQDLGRPGHARDGIAANGAADQYAARVANTLVGNAPTAPLIEITGSAFTFTTTDPLLMSVTGAAHCVVIDGRPQPAWETIAIAAASIVTIDVPHVGHRNYVAFQGTVEPDEPRLLGSISPDPMLDIGRKLVPGDSVLVRTGYIGLRHPHFDHVVLRLGAKRPHYSLPALIEITPGPDTDVFESGLDTIPSPFKVSSKSNYVGLRLPGTVPTRLGTSEILSRGVPIGAVEIPPQGGLLVLLRGRPITAGYPVIGVATSVDVDRLAQLRPGDDVRFRTVEHDHATARVRRRYEQLLALAKRVATVLESLGLGYLLDNQHLAQVTTGTHAKARLTNS